MVSPPFAQLMPLHSYKAFFLVDLERSTNELSHAQLGPCSAFPAGLVPRFQAILANAGHRVTVTDDRNFEEGFRVDKGYYGETHGQSREFLRAVLTQPLGQVHFQWWDDVLWRIACLCCVYPEARILIVANSYAAGRLQLELADKLGETVGLSSPDDWCAARSRCLAATYARFPSKSDRQILILVHFNSRTASVATLRAVVNLRAGRVYSFVPDNCRLANRTQLRLEAMAGPVMLKLT